MDRIDPVDSVARRRRRDRHRPFVLGGAAGCRPGPPQQCDDRDPIGRRRAGSSGSGRTGPVGDDAARSERVGSEMDRLPRAHGGRAERDVLPRHCLRLSLLLRHVPPRERLGRRPRLGHYGPNRSIQPFGGRSGLGRRIAEAALACGPRRRPTQQGKADYGAGGARRCPPGRSGPSGSHFSSSIR